MTIGTVGNALDELAKLLDVLRASSEAKSVRSLEAFLAPYSEANTASFLKKATPTRQVGSRWTGQRVGKLLLVLDRYNEMLDRLGSKAGKEFASLIKFLRLHEDADLDELMNAAREALTAVPPPRMKKSEVNIQLVADYVVRLKSALGKDSEFENVFGPLKVDKAARKQEITEIAKQMMPSPPTGADRKKGLKAIHDLHLTAKGFDLKLKASRGRSAA